MGAVAAAAACALCVRRSAGRVAVKAAGGRQASVPYRGVPMAQHDLGENVHEHLAPLAASAPISWSSQDEELLRAAAAEEDNMFLTSRGPTIRV